MDREDLGAEGEWRENKSVCERERERNRIGEEIEGTI